MRIRRAAGAISIGMTIVAMALVAGCGDDDGGGGDGSAAREASPTTDFPATDGKSV